MEKNLSQCYLQYHEKSQANTQKVKEGDKGLLDSVRMTKCQKNTQSS